MSPPIIKEQIRRALAKRRRQIVADPRLRRAAVLMPVYEDGDGLQVLFTKRSEELPHHKGQIAALSGCRRLVLTHFYPICDEYDIVTPCRKVFDGELILAEDLMRLPV